MKKNAFTLIELLAVIVIFAITFLIVVPSMNSLIGNSEKREIELIEERVLSAAKEYVNNFDGSFYKNFYKEGDTAYVYKSDLINAGLIDETEISKLNTFAGVKGELLSNERIRYTVEYINASNNEYTNEELYLMIKNLQNQGGSSGESGNTSSEDIVNLQNQINSLKNRVDDVEEVTLNMSVLKSYPVGSIYVSVDSENPGTKFGGTWVAFGAGRTLVGVDSSQTEFASVGLTGGEKEHTLTVGEMPKHKHQLQGMYIDYYNVSNVRLSIQEDGNMVLYDSMNKGLWDSGTHGSASEKKYYPIYFGNRDENTDTTLIGNSQPHNNLQPYITVYMWKRTA